MFLDVFSSIGGSRLPCLVVFKVPDTKKTTLPQGINFSNIRNIYWQDWPNIKTSLRSLDTKGDFPNGTLHTGFIMLDKAESAEFIELQPTPVLKYSVKTSILI